MNTIGRYQLVEKLGQGGMGIVYRAFDPLLQRVVAVKLIGALEANDELKERFFREARAAGQLSHKNIITIYDLGEHEGQPFLAMEYLEGQDLQQRLAAHAPPMTLARKLELAIEICEGIDYAHVHGVVHRDIKPANIFITATGTAKLLDFGLARLITSELTNSKMMMGTLNYMAPEQVRGERSDHRSDIFSTGVVLYELLGARKAFEGDSFGATLYKILQEVPEPLRNIDANLPPELVAVVERALEKTREARYQHMSEMLNELVAYRQRLMLINSPSYGRPGTDVTGVPSDAPTLASVPVTPLPAATPGSDRTPASEPIQAAALRVAAHRPYALASAVALSVLLAALVMWTINRDDPAPPQAAQGAAEPSAAETQQAIESGLERASQALQAGDEAAAQRHADAVLAISPGHAEARRLRDLARHAGETVTRSLASARELFAAGRYDEASRAAGEVLNVDPGNADAKRLMDDAAERSQGRGVQNARTRTAQAKNAATAAGAARLAPAPFGDALAAERAAARLFKQGRLAEAMSKFWEASGLFRSAAVAAQTEAAVRAERTRIAQAERKPAEPTTGEAAAPAPQKPAAPTPPPAPPVPTTTGLPLPSGAAPVTVPTPPPPAPPQQATQEAAPVVSPTSAINETLERYRAALESRNIESLKRVWPGLEGAQETAIRRDFQNSTRIEVEIVNPQITVDGTRATVTFIRRYQVSTVDGQQLRSPETRTTMSLQRTGTTWTIDRIRFDGVR